MVSPSRVACTPTGVFSVLNCADERSEALERTTFPERRQRAGLQAGGYFVLAPPGSFPAEWNGGSQGAMDAGVPAGSQQRKLHDIPDEQHNKRSELLPKRKLTTAQKKISKQQATHGELWRAAAAVLAAADPVYARQPFHLAVTKNFSGSPHIGKPQNSATLALYEADALCVCVRG